MASNNPGSSNAVAGALTDQPQNQNMQPVPQQPRQPTTLQGLLRFAMDATKAEDAPGGSSFLSFDEERFRFLENAMNQNVVRIDEIISRNLAVLGDAEKITNIKATDRLPEDVVTAFRELGEYIDDIDVASDFERMDGFSIFPLCYGTDNVELHRWANLTLAQACQSNPRCQERALRDCLLQVLLHWLRERRPKVDDRTVRAISSVARNYEPATRALISQGGCEAVCAVLRDEQRIELASAAFLMAYLCRVSGEARGIFIKNGIIPTVVDLLRSGRCDASEFLLNMLYTLSKSVDCDVRSIYRDPALGLRKVIRDHLKNPEVKNGTYQEEKEHCEKILKFINNGRPDPLDDDNETESVEDVEPADR